MLIQNWIYGLETAGGRFLKFALLVLVLGAVALGYDLFKFGEMSNPEAMDAAQVARNLAEGKGYTTLCVRPLSLHLLQKAWTDTHGPPPVGDMSDRGQLRGLHPDLANAPAYPVILAGLMKTWPGFRYKAFAGRSLTPWVYPPDLLICLFNQLIFITIVLLVFFFAQRLFDSMVAWISTVALAGTDLFWRFSISGLSTLLLMLIFFGLFWCLTRLEQGAREGNRTQKSLLILTAVIGALVGVGGLARYAFAWLIIPVLVFVVLFSGPQRVVLFLTALAVFALVMTPWVVRNYRLSHTLFGTAGFAIYEATSYFPGDLLERSLNPDLTVDSYARLSSKFISNVHHILREDLLELCGNWLGAFFLAGLMVAFRNPALNRARWFLLMCLPVLITAQALGRTHLSEQSPVVNSENLLVLLAPLVIVFGVSFFFVLLEQMRFPEPNFRYFVMAVFCAVVCLPTVFKFLTPRFDPGAYSLNPPAIQRLSGWMKEDELMMSDVPWAVAWYGKRQCVWLTLNSEEDFFNIYDYQKPIQALYLTPVTMDSPFLTQWYVRKGERTWGKLALDSLYDLELPAKFPLRHRPDGFLPSRLFLSDSDRWSEPAATGRK